MSYKYVYGIYTNPWSTTPGTPNPNCFGYVYDSEGTTARSPLKEQVVKMTKHPVDTSGPNKTIQMDKTAKFDFEILFEAKIKASNAYQEHLLACVATKTEPEEYEAFTKARIATELKILKKTYRVITTGV